MIDSLAWSNRHDVKRELKELRPFRQGDGRGFYVEGDRNTAQLARMANSLAALQAAVGRIEKTLGDDTPSDDDVPF